MYICKNELVKKLGSRSPVFNTPAKVCMFHFWFCCCFVCCSCAKDNFWFLYGQTTFLCPKPIWGALPVLSAFLYVVFNIIYISFSKSIKCVIRVNINANLMKPSINNSLDICCHTIFNYYYWYVS